MNTDIRLSVNFWDHPKTLKLKRRLGGDGPLALLALWCWAGKNRPDGDLSRMDDEDIELAAMWDSARAGELVPVLVALRWLDRTEAGYVLHEWQEHNSWAAKSEDRSDRGRFAKLAKTDPAAYNLLKAQGVTAITREDYETIVAERRPMPGMLSNASSNASQGASKSKQSLSNVEVNLSKSETNVSKTEANLSNAEASLSNAEADLSKTTSPAPAPAPAPAPDPDPDPDPVPDPAHNAHTPPDGGAGGAGGARPGPADGSATPCAQEFERFYTAYPRRVQRTAALKAWKALQGQGVEAGAPVKAAAAYQAATAAKGTPADKIMHPATFLREDRWRDWLPPDGASYREARELAGARKSVGSAPPTRPMTYEEAAAKYRASAASAKRWDVGVAMDAEFTEIEEV